MVKSTAMTVIGAGGIGCAVGYSLLQAGITVEFVDVDAAKVEAGNREGVRVGGHPASSAKFIQFADWRPAPGRLHWLCTKCYDNEAVFARLPADVQLVPVQNGIDPALDQR